MESATFSPSRAGVGEGMLGQLLSECGDDPGRGIDAYRVWQDGAMPRKKRKRFRAVEAVKAMARERIGPPPASRVIPDRKKTKKEKHKPRLEDWLDDAGG